MNVVLEFSGIVLVLASSLIPAQGLKCLRCNEVVKPILCDYITTCGSGEICGIEKISNEDGDIRYNLGCKSEKTCRDFRNVSSHRQTKSSQKLGFTMCQDCCEGDICNAAGCGEQGYPSDIGPLCLNCENMDNPTMCRRIKACEDDEICFIQETMKFHVKWYTSKCQQKHICEALKRGPDLIGRKRRRINNHHTKRSTALCLDCCSENVCNDHCGSTNKSNSNNVDHTRTSTTTLSTVTRSTVTTTEYTESLKPTLASKYTNMIGRQFLIVFASNYGIHESAFAQVLISSTENGWYHINVPYLGIHENRSLTLGNNVFNLSKEIQTKGFMIEQKGMWLETSHPVSVYAVNLQYGSSDGFYVIPVIDLSLEYIIVTEEPLGNAIYWKSQIAVSATDDKTVINFMFNTNGTITYNRTSYDGNRILTIVLNRYQTFEIQHVHDLTGTIVKSSKPIAVVSGNLVGNVFIGTGSHLSEMIPPIKSIDNRYIIPTFTSDFDDRYLRIVAAYNGTSVQLNTNNLVINNSLDISMSENKLYKQNNFVSVSSSKGTLVALLVHYQYGPFMTIVPGINQYLSSYTFSVPDAGFTSSCSIVIKSYAISGLRYDNQLISENCSVNKTAFNSENYCVMIKSTASGIHNLHHIANETFGLFIYGYRDSDSYGYFAGMRFR